MTREPDLASDYDARGVQAVRGVLVELGQVLGSYLDAIVVIGGGVPHLLLPDARPRHVGTLDIDLDLDSDRLGGGRYAELVELLEHAGYERDLPGLKPFQLLRSISVSGGPPVAVIVDLLMPRNAKPRKNRPVFLEGLRVQRCDGAEVGLANYTEVRVEGKMPDGRDNSVSIRVATVPALLVMKGFALVGRDKKKDALVHACLPLLEQDEAREGFEHIASKFRHMDDFGPVTVRSFLADTSLMGGMSSEQVQIDAYAQVSALLTRIGIVDPAGQ